MAEPFTSHDWPWDLAPHEWHKCVYCYAKFSGGAKRTVCRVCAPHDADPSMLPTPAELAARITALEAHVRRLYESVFLTSMPTTAEHEAIRDEATDSANAHAEIAGLTHQLAEAQRKVAELTDLFCEQELSLEEIGYEEHIAELETQLTALRDQCAARFATVLGNLLACGHEHDTGELQEWVTELSAVAVEP